MTRQLTERCCYLAAALCLIAALVSVAGCQQGGLLISDDPAVAAEQLAKRTKRYKQDNRAVTVVGVKVKAATTVNGKPHRPANIEHLLHEGFIHAKSGQFVPGTHWMEKATQAKHGEVARRIRTKLDREVTKEVQKLRR